MLESITLPFFLSIAVLTVCMQEEKISLLFSTSKDITDRKNAEEEIQKSNERFEIIAQATNDAVWDHDFTKNETWGNKKLYSLYGFDSVNAKIDFQMFIQRIHPDERDGIVKRLQDAIGRSEHSLAEEFHFKTATGEYRTFYDRAYIKYGADGRPQRILGAMQDVTDREHSEKQILKEKELSDTIINSLPGVFYLFNKEGKSLLVMIKPATAPSLSFKALILLNKWVLRFVLG